MVLRVKKLIRVSLLCLTMLATVLPTMPTTEVLAASDCTINLSSKKQVIQGFGGMNHPIWVGDLTASQRETAFGNGDNQLDFSILRIHVDENKNNWSKELATAQSAIKHGAIVFASPWNPPSDMTEKFTRNGVANQQRLRYDKYAAYAQYLNDFVTFMKDNGVDLYAISVQNEPDYAQDWTWWTPQEMLNFMKNNAGSINCRVIAPESFQYLKSMSDPILNDSQALANMDILGTHFYGTSVSNMAYPLFQQKGAGKGLWMTEVYVPNSDANSADRWPEAVEVSYNIHNAMVNNFQAYVWWSIRRQYSPMKEDGTISKRGYCMAQYSKFVLPGYARVDATSNPNTNVYVSAYKGDDGKVAIVAINKGSSAVDQKFVVNNGTISQVDSWRTSSSENLKKTTGITVTNGSFSASLPANSVTTFVGSSSSTPTTPTKDADGYYLHSTFENDGTDNWAARGSSEVLNSGTTAQAGTKAMLVRGRTSAWNGAQYALSDNYAGKAYSFSGCVRCNTADADFCMSLVYTDSSGETKYLHINDETTAMGNWLQLKNTNFTIPAGATNIYLYFETAEGTENFYVDEVIMADPGTVISGPAPVIIETTTTTPEPTTTEQSVTTTAETINNDEVKYGDVNLNGNIDISDVILLNKYLVKSVSFNLTQKENADCVYDGKIEIKDNFEIVRCICRIITASQLGVH